MKKINITVVICTYNRSTLLLKTLDSIKAAKIPESAKLKVLVIANSCTDNTLKALSDYSFDTIEFQVADEPKPGKSNALNYAIKLIDKNTFVCFIDDDHRIDKDYFIRIEHNINQYPKTKIFCGRIIPDWTGNEPSWVLDNGQYKIYPFPIPHFEMGNHPCLVTQHTKLPGGGNLIVHASVFDTVGFFSTELGPQGDNLAGSEDSDFILRALNKGISIQYMPDIIQYHFVDRNRLKLNYLIKKSYQRTRTLMLTKHPLKQPVPLYLWRKLFTYILSFALSISADKRRFYLVRTAAVLGEINGFRHSLKGQELNE